MNKSVSHKNFGLQAETKMKATRVRDGLLQFYLIWDILYTSFYFKRTIIYTYYVCGSLGKYYGQIVLWGCIRWAWGWGSCILVEVPCVMWFTTSIVSWKEWLGEEISNITDEERKVQGTRMGVLLPQPKERINFMISSQWRSNTIN